ncbi:ALMS1 protein, partial [Piprites chloris]|nr:ALMS1 protein [Piprites chloris]
ALSAKRRTRMLNKGIQAGDLEIVNGATKRNTRDVGLTFPTPRPVQPIQRPRECWRAVLAVSSPSSSCPPSLLEFLQEKDHGWEWTWHVFVCQSSFSPVLFQTGTSWFVQGEDLKSESRKENHSRAIPGPGPSWFEPWSSTKPWREPLREKNWEEQ